MFAAFAEFERGKMKERQKEGIAKARADKKYKGGSRRREQRPVKQSSCTSNRNPYRRSPRPWASVGRQCTERLRLLASGSPRCASVSPTLPRQGA